MRARHRERPTSFTLIIPAGTDGGAERSAAARNLAAAAERMRGAGLELLDARLGAHDPHLAVCELLRPARVRPDHRLDARQLEVAVAADGPPTACPQDDRSDRDARQRAASIGFSIRRIDVGPPGRQAYLGGRRRTHVLQAKIALQTSGFGVSFGLRPPPIVR